MPFRKQSGRFQYTIHALGKMRQYQLSKSRVENTIRHPARIETGIASGTVAAMLPDTRDRPTEVWVLYKTVRNDGGTIRIITAWRYPGTSPERAPLPPQILEEIEEIVRQ